MKIQLTQDKFALIDNSDFDLVKDYKANLKSDE